MERWGQGTRRRQNGRSRRLWVHAAGAQAGLFTGRVHLSIHPVSCPFRTGAPGEAQQGPGSGGHRLWTRGWGLSVGEVTALPPRPSPSSPRGWTSLERDQSLGFRPSGRAPLPTNWPECGRPGLGTVPTDAASWACPARGGTLTPGALRPVFLAAQASVFRQTWWAGGPDSPAAPATGGSQAAPSSPSPPPSL